MDNLCFWVNHIQFSNYIFIYIFQKKSVYKERNHKNITKKIKLEKVFIFMYQKGFNHIWLLFFAYQKGFKKVICVFLMFNHMWLAYVTIFEIHKTYNTKVQAHVISIYFEKCIFIYFDLIWFISHFLIISTFIHLRDP